jgi:hypothetical protein
MLSEILTEELTQPAPDAARAFADEICRRHGAAVAAVLFYGSCLRKQTTEGVLDFYVLVDSYRAVFSSPLFATLNAILPPNVFYLEVQVGKDEQETVRGKYAVISLQDFSRAASPQSLYAIIWGRFCQPTLLVHSRDSASRTAVIGSFVEAALTMVGRMAALLPERFQAMELWQRGFQETYRTELRAEKPGTVQAIYQAAPERYDRIASEALQELERRGTLQVCSTTAGPDAAWKVAFPPQQRSRVQRDWKTRRPIAKARYAVWLLKSAATFGDWLPYVFWKVGRHAGVTLQPTERQRRHPFLCGGPAVLKLLLQRNLR